MQREPLRDEHDRRSCFHFITAWLAAGDAALPESKHAKTERLLHHSERCIPLQRYFPIRKE